MSQRSLPKDLFAYFKNFIQKKQNVNEVNHELDHEEANLLIIGEGVFGDCATTEIQRINKRFPKLKIVSLSQDGSNYMKEEIDGFTKINEMQDYLEWDENASRMSGLKFQKKMYAYTSCMFILGFFAWSICWRWLLMFVYRVVRVFCCICRKEMSWGKSDI